MRHRRRLPLVIGPTVVAGATSAPELAVSVTAAPTGAPGLAIGLAIGSRIFDIGAVLWGSPRR